MPIKNILVPVESGDSGGAAVRAASEAAVRLGAHLVGAMLVPDLTEELMRSGNDLVRRVQSVHLGFVIPEGGLARVVEVAEAKQKAEIARAREGFAKALAAVRLPLLDAGSPIGLVPSASFQKLRGGLMEPRHEFHALTEAALLADLVVLPREMKDHSLDTHIAVDILFQAGRPVVIAWNASPPAAHAVSRAVPFLERAEKVTILEIIGSHLGSDAAALALYLARQGIRTESVCTPPKSGESIALQISQEAKQVGGDLLVIGGYGHSRFREIVLGSVTEQMIAQAGMPVFITH